MPDDISRHPIKDNKLLSVIVSNIQEPPARRARLPAVLHVAGHTPCFGTIASLSSQGLAFDFQGDDHDGAWVGSRAKLDLSLAKQHHSLETLIVHIQGRRALLSLRETPPALVAELTAALQHATSPLSFSLSVLQRQEACHRRFMEHIKNVVADFFRMLAADPGHAQLKQALEPMRPMLTRHFSQAYPMYPETQKPTADASFDVARVDEWIQRTAIAQAITEAIEPLVSEFTTHYNAMLRLDSHLETHPYHPDAVLRVLSVHINPLNLSPETRLLAFRLMGQAFQQDAATLYQALLDLLGELPPGALLGAGEATNLTSWLKAFALRESPSEPDGGTAATMGQINDLTALLVRLTENLEVAAASAASTNTAANAAAPGMLIPALIARDRIMDRFAPAGSAPDAAQPGTPASDQHSQALGRLTDLDGPALEALQAVLRQPPAIEPGPERLPPSSQVRSLLLQGQGLLQEYTLNGLTYHDQPTHPAWALINALDALHRGADDQGRFLNTAIYQATSLAMQWLLDQPNTDAALTQVNALLATINAQLLTEYRARRQQHLDWLGALTSTEIGIDADWCVVRRNNEAIPYEVLGQRDEQYALLNRSATRLLEISAKQLADEVDHGLIELADSYDVPFLERTARTNLATSLRAVHTYTWQDPASGCLKRTALVDELERRLAHPVSEPPSFCALIEIPTLRPSLSSLPGDELTVMQNRTGELLKATMNAGEQCGRLSDIAFMMVFNPQAPEQLAARLTRLKADMEDLHIEWKLIGAAIPLVGNGESPSPSDVLRRADKTCAGVRAEAGFDLSCLENVPPVSNRIEPLPFDSLYLRAQKIAACADGAVSHYEILLGVSEGLEPCHSTQSFVVMAEQTGRIHELDCWTLRTVLEWMQANAVFLRQINGFSVNLSGSTLAQPEAVDNLVQLLREYPLLADKLTFEVTETAAIVNLDTAVSALRRLRKLGSRIALDDFGSGYSSYSYLRSLPLDYLKIDGTYIRQVVTNKTDQALTASMVDVAHALGLKVIAEYVDSEAIYAWLKNVGVDYAQGYWVHEPERLEDLVLN